MTMVTTVQFVIINAYNYNNNNNNKSVSTCYDQHVYQKIKSLAPPSTKVRTAIQNIENGVV